MRWIVKLLLSATFFQISMGGGMSLSGRKATVIDVQDYGVVGNGIADDTTAVQNALNAACNAPGAGRELVTPYNTLIAVSSTVKLDSCSGVHIDFASGQGESSTLTSGFIWIGANGGGPVLQINRVRDSIFENFFIQQGKTGGNQANVPLDIDENGGGSTIVTHNRFSNIAIGFGASGLSANSNFRGIQLGLNAPGNVDDQEFDRIRIQCPGPLPTSNTSNGYGFVAAAGSSAQPYNTVIWNSNISDCSRGYFLQLTITLVNIGPGLMNGNWTDLYSTNGTNTNYHDIRSEGGREQIVANAGTITLRRLSFSNLTPGSATITLGGAGTYTLDSLLWDDVAVTPLSISTASLVDFEHSRLPTGGCPDMSSTGLNPIQGLSYMNSLPVGYCTNQRKGTIATVN